MVRESEIEELIHSVEWRVEGDRIVFVVPSRTTRGRRYPVVVSRRDRRVLDHSPCPAWLKGLRCWHLRAVERMLVRETLLSYGCIVPGHNTLKRIEIKWSKHRPRRERERANVAILLDASGSMKDCGGLKARAARDAAISLIGACGKHGYSVKVIVFDGDVDWYTGWREDHYRLALELLRRYRAGGGTNIVPALELLARGMRPKATIYLISDMEIYDVRKSASRWSLLARYEPRVVVFLIGTKIGEVLDVLRQAGIRDIKGYALKHREYRVLREKAVKALPV